MEKIDRYVTRAEDFCGGEWLNSGILNSESGGGGLKSTASDMTRFGQMYLNRGHLDGKWVLSPASIRELTANQNMGLADSVYQDETFDSSWSLSWNVRRAKKDDGGMLRSPSAFNHGGYGCVQLMCDPVYDLVTAFFTVCKTDTYYKAANFVNMVIGAIVT
jgi:CubicO group peptidase (beta-lactamase class C family)